MLSILNIVSKCIMTYSVQNNIVDLREKKGVTQEELAKAIDVSRQTVIALEKGNYSPSLLLAFRISMFFERPIESIFKLN